MYSHPKYKIGDLVRILDNMDEDSYYTDARKNRIVEDNSVGVIIDIHFMYCERGKPQYFVKWIDTDNWQTLETEGDLIRVENRI